MDSLFERMREDEDVFFLTADMGINLVEKIQKAFPSRYLNVGISEQNLIGIAAGLCNLGYRPFAYTISQFMIHRCYEQIRNDIVLHSYPITLLGTATGFDNAPLGPTHHVVDDWGALRVLPGIDIYCPSSVIYAETVVEKVLANGRPAFVRIPKGEFERPPSAEDAVYIEGEKKGVLLVSYGSPVQSCLKVQETHDDVSVLVFNRLRPFDEDVVSHAFANHERVFVVEDHFPSSGMYNMMSQFCVENQIDTRLKSIAPPHAYWLKVGSSADYYERVFRLDESGIEEAVFQAASHPESGS